MNGIKNDMWQFYWWIAVFVGAIPILARLFACLLNNGIHLDFYYIFNALDISLMGLAINWTNVTENIHLVVNNKKTKQRTNLAVNILSFLTIALIFSLGGIIFILYWMELNPGHESVRDNARWIALFLTLASTRISYTYVKKINTM